jgi:hypothetical protein
MKDDELTDSVACFERVKASVAEKLSDLETAASQHRHAVSCKEHGSRRKAQLTVVMVRFRTSR